MRNYVLETLAAFCVQYENAFRCKRLNSPNFLTNEPVLEYIFGVMELSLRIIYFRLYLCASVVLILHHVKRFLHCIV